MSFLIISLHAESLSGVGLYLNLFKFVEKKAICKIEKVAPLHSSHSTLYSPKLKKEAVYQEINKVNLSCTK